MEDLKLGVVEERFAELIWQNEPLSSRELAQICERELGWKRPTTYTVLRKLCEKGIFQNADGVVSSLIAREDFYAMRGERFVAETYGGSLPAFIAAFTARNTLTDEEADAIQKMIDAARREG
ncbi:MAG: BlaI/MecI/CopY family transcriptional regulator [Ruminococcaceae bacterium]|nr:BlaI/MecI/CopY family transcriptional regulator [Oscillospiraceae bacterium]